MPRSLEKRPQDGSDPLDAAIRAAQKCLIEESRSTVLPEKGPGGSSAAARYWVGELEADTTLESDYIIFHYFLEPDSWHEKIHRLAAYIRRHQLPDGSWNIYPDGPGEISATVKAYLALKIAGHGPDEPLMVRAREAIHRLGGIEKVNSYTKFYLALLDQLDWSEVPAIPPEVVLIPRFFYINIYEISYWSRAILIPLAILYALRPVRPLPPHMSIDELFAEGRRRPWLRLNGKQPLGGRGVAPLRVENDLSLERAGDTVTDRVGGEEELRASIREAVSNPDTWSRSRRNGNGKGNGIAKANGNGNGNGISSGNGNGNGNGIAKLNGNGSGISSGNGNGNGISSGNGYGNGNGYDPIFCWENFFVLADRVLKIVEKSPVKPLRRLAIRKAEEWMVSRFEDSDGLGAIFPSMCNSVMAMLALGYEGDHPLMRKALGELEELEIEEGDTLRLQPCVSPVWDTAHAVNALHESGMPEDHPVLVEANRWLVSKEVRKPGDWRVRVPGVEVSGWYFQFRNEFYPDVDDTAAVLMALERSDASEIDGLEESVARGIRWVIDMQCSDGGWAAFDVDVKRELLERVPYADHKAMLDPTCPDISGRCLEMLGRFPLLTSDPLVEESIRRGVDYLKACQEEDGSWYGRWGVNYIYATWQALKGLVQVGEDPSAEYIRHAVEFLRRHQNDDGGWGESCRSYEDPESRGQGVSTASQTAWAVMGLIAVGETDSPEVERGIRYLLETQGLDGNWEEDHWTGTGFPTVFYLKYHLYRLYFPLFALGMYRNVRSGANTVRERPDIRLPLSRQPEGLGGRAARLRSLLRLQR